MFPRRFRLHVAVALLGMGVGCLEAPTALPPAQLETPIISPTAVGDQVPDTSLPYLTRVQYGGSNWLSNVMMVHRRRFGFNNLNVEAVLADARRTSQARSMMSRGLPAVRSALQEGIAQARLLDARLRHEPTLTSPAPEIQGSWIVFDRLGLPRP